MNITKLAVVMACQLALAACGPEAEMADESLPYEPYDDPAFSLTIWTDGDPMINSVVAWRGCSAWLSKGVICQLTDDPELADVKIHAWTRPCEYKEDGSFILATAYDDGTIQFRTDCIHGGEKQVKTVLAHEIGHQVGIWGHIPKNCDDEEADFRFGPDVCGRALMNPYYSSSMNYVSGLDAQAFELRNIRYSRLQSLPQSEEGQQAIEKLRRELNGSGNGDKPIPVPICTFHDH